MNQIKATVKTLFIVLLMTPLIAQSDRKPYRGKPSFQRPNLEAKWQSYFKHFGHNALDFEISLQNFGKDDNLFLQADSEKLEDTTGQAQFKAMVLSRFSQKSFFEAEAKVQHDWYQEQDQLSGTHGGVLANYIVLGKSWYSEVGYFYDQKRQNPSSELDENPKLKETGPTFIFHHGIGPKLSINWEASALKYEFEKGSKSEILNRKSNKGNVHAILNLKKISPFFQVVFEDLDFDLGLKTQGSHLFCGFKGPPGKRTQMDAKVGYFNYEYRSTTFNSSQNDWAMEGFIKHKFTRQFLGEIGYSRQPLFSVISNGNYISKRFLLGVSKDWSRFWSSSLSVFVGENEYPAEFLEADDSAVETYEEYQIDLAWKPSVQFEIKLIVGKKSRESENLIREADQNRFTLNIYYKPN